MTSWKTVYHTTILGGADKIVSEGWVVTRWGTNIYGRGIYFWELLDDAHTYGKHRFGEKQYEIVSEKIPIKDDNTISYEHGKAYGGIDSIAKGLLRRGIQVVMIPNPMIEATTLSQAKGKAFLWLVDIDEDLTIVQ